MSEEIAVDSFEAVMARLDNPQAAPAPVAEPTLESAPPAEEVENLDLEAPFEAEETLDTDAEPTPDKKPKKRVSLDWATKQINVERDRAAKLEERLETLTNQFSKLIGGAETTDKNVKEDETYDFIDEDAVKFTKKELSKQEEKLQNEALKNYVANIKLREEIATIKDPDYNEKYAFVISEHAKQLRIASGGRMDTDTAIKQAYNQLELRKFNNYNSGHDPVADILYLSKEFGYANLKQQSTPRSEKQQINMAAIDTLRKEAGAPVVQAASSVNVDSYEAVMARLEAEAARKKK